VLGALQREHLRTLFARDHYRIHFSAADGAERFLHFGQAHAEFGEFAERPAGCCAGRRGAGGALVASSFQSAILPFVIKSNSPREIAWAAAP
jgi:hypothetical protein